MKYATEHPLLTILLGGGLIIGIQILVLALLGQPLICTCGYIKLWEGVVSGAGNSQHLTDWYTFSHIIHGFLFYLFLWWLFPRMPIALRLLAALGIEVGWEILENSPWVINHYREQALAALYSGDSILNSASDSIAMATGFVLAWRLSVWAIIAIGVVFELVALYFIRDNLFLNVLNLIYQFDFIHVWQSEAAIKAILGVFV